MFAPSPDLRSVVDCYWVGAWNLDGQEPHTVQLLGDPCVHLVMERGASRVVGVWTETWTRTLAGTGLVRAIKLRAGAVRAVLTRPALSFTDQLIPLGDVLPFDSSHEDAVLSPDAHDDGVLRLEAWLRQRLVADRSVHSHLAVELMERIAADHSMVRVEAVAQSVGLSVRSLQRLFDEHVGASPKWAIRRHRLQEAAVRIEAGDDLPLARLAAELGYSDHGHLTRDFQRAVGKPPSVFARDVHV